MIVFEERYIAEKQSTKSAHMKHLQYLSAEINKIKNCLSLIIIYDFFFCEQDVGTEWWHTFSK